MNRATVAVLAAFDAVITAAIGLGIALAPLTIVWAVQYRMAVSWFAFWKAAADAWLVGHGVDLAVHLDSASGLSLGLGGAVVPFAVTTAALGVGLFTVAMGARMGRRAAETPFVLTGAVTAVVVFALVAQVVAFTAGVHAVRPVLWQAAPLAALTLAVGIAVGVGLHLARTRTEPPAWLAAVLGPLKRAILARALRTGLGSAALALAAAGVFLAILVFAKLGTLVSLYEGLQAGYLGGVTLTLAQLAVLPNAVVWAASWLVGPGFSVGAGTSVAVTGSTAGSLPGVPLLALVPQHTLVVAFAGVLVPLLAGFASAYLLRLRFPAAPAGASSPLGIAATAIGSGLVAGLVLGVLAWWSSGSLAPGALAHLGPNGVWVGLFGALEVAVGSAAGLIPATSRVVSDVRSPA